MSGSQASTFLFTLPIFLISLTVHEYAHGWMAYRYGDDTAARMVYASLKSPEAINMYRNFSQFGMLIFVAFLFLGGFRIIIIPFINLFFTLFGLPLPT